MEVNIDDDVLTIRGHADRSIARTKAVRRGAQLRPFFALPLPGGRRAGAVEASYQDGVLGCHSLSREPTRAAEFDVR